MRLSMTFLLPAAAAALALAAPPAEALPQDGAGPRAAIEVKPGDVEIGMFYRGTNVHVEGVAPAGYRLALVCLGAEDKVELKRKGKVLQVLWMNVGDVSFEHVPSLYLASWEPRAQDLPRASPDPAAAYDHIEAQVLPAQADSDTRRLFREFVKLKEEENLYSSAPLHLDGSTSGSRRISADFFLPATAPAGSYEVRLVGQRGGANEILATERLVTRRVGLASLISSAAATHGLLYGILSVLLAIVAGFLTGVIFAGAKKGH
jgi:hypothetical protein